MAEKLLSRNRSGFADHVLDPRRVVRKVALDDRQLELAQDALLRFTLQQEPERRFQQFFGSGIGRIALDVRRPDGDLMMRRATRVLHGDIVNGAGAVSDADEQGTSREEVRTENS